MNIDQPTDIRANESLDAQALLAYLLANVPDLTGAITIQQFPGGYSNLTYAVTVGTTELVLRRPPFGANVKSGHDMGREYRILSNLIDIYPRVPRPVAYCEDTSVLGAPFYVMERITGVILRGKMAPSAYPSASLMKTIAESFVQNFAQLHAIDVHSTDLNDLSRGAGYVERQVEGWIRRYQKAQTDDIPQMEAISAWLNHTLPDDQPHSLIHNDYKYDNMVLDPTTLKDGKAKIIGVLDWEMATIGDPLMDLGTTLGYWVQSNDNEFLQGMALNISHLPGNPTRHELVQLYEETRGLTIQNPVFYYVYGLFKLAVILQQIYARYKLGHTSDERFAVLIYGVKALASQAVQCIDTNSLG